MDQEFVRNRITELRQKKGVSEYQMSQDLGHSKGYIQSISSGRSFPSWPEFFYILDYLEISARDFFDTEQQDPILARKILDKMRYMNDEDLLFLLSVIQKMGNSK